ncbi:MAG: hypothetical protein J6L75_03085 [Alistipes sp.]|nr:hypothetical protein [Alistipes sp.]
MRLTEKIIRAVRDSFDTLLFFATMAVKEDFRNHVARAGVQSMHPDKRIFILGNGPSLGKQLTRLIENKAWESGDIMAVNFFALSREFTVLKPKYYVLSDPQFFRKAGHSERVKEMYCALAESVSWPMTLYIQYYNPEKFDYAAAVGHNPNIRIVKFHTTLFRGFRSVEFWCYRRGLGSGNFGTVVQNGEFIAMLLGYRTIELFGVDHTLLDGLAVNEQNQLCRIASHYYDNAPAEAKPIFVNATNPPRPYTMHTYLAETAELFRGHEVLADYARTQGIRIVNRTRNSMIDSYERCPLP